ncbi:MAG: L,D-transpeptidase [Cyanobacteriota bacterium]|nr:L,D-transpeptidase [Cyanobacteriota bacterium]
MHWVHPRWRRSPGIQPRLLGSTLLFMACSSAWVPGLQAAEAPEPLGKGKPDHESGAAALLEDAPFQLGLKENGLPQPEAPKAEAEPSPTQTKPSGLQGSRPRLLILDRRQRLLRVMDNGQEVRRYPVAVGMPGWETPVGQFTVIEKTANPKWEHPANGQVLPPGPNNPLGSRWIGFHRDCSGRSGFNGQEHLVVKGCVTAGFHGTPNRASVGRAVSHGCVRLFDEHAKELFDLVSLGTPVTVLP